VYFLSFEPLVFTHCSCCQHNLTYSFIQVFQNLIHHAAQLFSCSCPSLWRFINWIWSLQFYIVVEFAVDFICKCTTLITWIVFIDGRVDGARGYILAGRGYCLPSEWQYCSQGLLCVISSRVVGELAGQLGHGVLLSKFLSEDRDRRWGMSFGEIPLRWFVFWNLVSIITIYSASAQQGTFLGAAPHPDFLVYESSVIVCIVLIWIYGNFS